MPKRPRGEAQRHAGAMGKRFDEDCIGLQLEVARQRGTIAFLDHAEPTARLIKGRLMKVVQGAADWSGFFGGGALVFVIECKSIQGHRFYFADFLDKRNRLREQAVHMEAAAAAGGVSLLAIEFRDPETFARDAIRPPRRFVVPWRKIPWEVALTAKSVTADALAGWELAPTGSCFLDRFVWRCPQCRRISRRDLSHPCYRFEA